MGGATISINGVDVLAWVRCLETSIENNTSGAVEVECMQSFCVTPLLTPLRSSVAPSLPGAGGLSFEASHVSLRASGRVLFNGVDVLGVLSELSDDSPGQRGGCSPGRRRRHPRVTSPSSRSGNTGGRRSHQTRSVRMPRNTTGAGEHILARGRRQVPRNLQWNGGVTTFESSRNWVGGCAHTRARPPAQALANYTNEWYARVYRDA